MELKELANEIIKYGECIFDKRTHNTRIQHYLYNNHGYEIIRQDGKFIAVKLKTECVKRQKQLKLIQDYFTSEIVPKVLSEIYQLKSCNDVYDFADLISCIIYNKVDEDKTYKLLDELQEEIE